jgi:hypothetical protein
LDVGFTGFSPLYLAEHHGDRKLLHRWFSPHGRQERKEREREREARNKIKDILSETYFLQLGPNISSTSQNCTTSHHIQACGTHFLFKL